MTRVRMVLLVVVVGACQAKAPAKLADGTACPAGSKVVGQAPPAGTAQWCERGGKKDGPFVEWLAGTPLRKKREGAFAGGALAGRWKTYFPGGALQREVAYEAGKMHGVATELHENGKKKEEGAYEHGTRVGEWTMWYPGGARLRSTVYSEAGMVETWTVYRESDGSKYMEGRFAGAKKDGTFTEYDGAGKRRIQGDWKAGVKQGRWVTYDASGAELGVQEYKDGAVVSVTGSPVEQVAVDPSAQPSEAGAQLPF